MRAARSDSDVENTMTRFSWLTELAAAEPKQALLISGARQWRAAEIRGELLSLKERLATCRVLGVLADNSPAWVLADLAAHEAGVVHLPLPGFFSAGQLRHALEQTAADVILTDQPERIGALDLGFAIIGHWQGLTWMQRVVEPVALPAGTAKISFTSGSTGAPKGSLPRRRRPDRHRTRRARAAVRSPLAPSSGRAAPGAAAGKRRRHLCPAAARHGGAPAAAA
jgi:acyl-CoA synthetase (AMP-forming)/AMP-acid ligase II